MNTNVKKLCLTAMGIALFVVMAMAIRFPIFENYYLCLGYVAMAVFLYSLGIVPGTIVGTFGVILYCILTSGLRGMPGWTVGNLVIGILLGISFKMTKKLRPAAFYAINTIVVAASTFLGIMIVKSLVECLLYSQPMILRMGKNAYAFVADVAILVISLFFCKLLGKTIKLDENTYRDGWSIK